MASARTELESPVDGVEVGWSVPDGHPLMPGLGCIHFALWECQLCRNQEAVEEKCIEVAHLPLHLSSSQTRVGAWSGYNGASQIRLVTQKQDACKAGVVKLSWST